MRIILTLTVGILIAVTPLTIQAQGRSGPVYSLTVEKPVEHHELSLWGKIVRAIRLSPVRIIAPKPGQEFRVTAVAYSSTPDQTYGDPCITAMGTRVREGVVATNFLPLGTRIRIGGEEFVVEDRMHSRYDGKHIIDVWHPTREQAILFGAQHLTIEILPAESEVIVEDEEPVEEDEQVEEVIEEDEQVEEVIEEDEQVEEVIEEDESLPALGILVDAVRRVISRLSHLIGTRVLPPDAEC